MSARARFVHVFSTFGAGGPQIYSIDLTGYNEQLVSTPTYASDPAWSPLLE